MAGKLTARKVEAAKPGKYSDGGNLYLIVSPTGARKWVLRFTWHGKAREMGLGSPASDSLADAREKAAHARRMVARGIDPIAERKRTGGVPTFGEMADQVHESLSGGFRNAKHATQWKWSLATYAASLRDKPVDAISVNDVLQVLKPIWQTKAETASRVRGRIEKILDAAKAKGFRQGENPARWRGHLDHLLAKQSKITRGHHAAMDYQDVAAFIGRLRERDGLVALALEFCILTAARSNEVLKARWSEVDLEKGIWTLPPIRMKAGREHRVALSKRATAILRRLAEIRTGDFVFPGRHKDRPLSERAMHLALRRMKFDTVTVHGFRSSFRDWAGNETHYPRDLIETALAHVIADKTELAYRRGDALQKRRTLMEAWAAYCDPNRTAKVLQLHGRTS
jgi:integrase